MLETSEAGEYTGDSGSAQMAKKKGSGGMKGKQERRGRPRTTEGTVPLYFRTTKEFADEVRQAADDAGQKLIVFIERTMRKGMAVR